jgi:hypothetical protein
MIDQMHDILIFFFLIIIFYVMPLFLSSFIVFNKLEKHYYISLSKAVHMFTNAQKIK